MSTPFAPPHRRSAPRERTTTYPQGTHCQRCGKVITEGADVRSGEVRIRCRNCKGINVISDRGHDVIDA